VYQFLRLGHGPVTKRWLCINSGLLRVVVQSAAIGRAPGRVVAVRDVGRSETEELGAIQPGQRAVSGVERFNRDLQATAAGLDAATRESLRSSFGDQITIAGDAVVWQGQ
jgi:hypothetical protein